MPFAPESSLLATRSRKFYLSVISHGWPCNASNINRATTGVSQDLKGFFSQPLETRVCTADWKRGNISGSQSLQSSLYFTGLAAEPLPSVVLHLPSLFTRKISIELRDPPDSSPAVDDKSDPWIFVEPYSLIPSEEQLGARYTGARPLDPKFLVIVRFSQHRGNARSSRLPRNTTSNPRQLYPPSFASPLAQFISL